ncbi:ABC transporter ATP-binding protein [Novosphingobium mangrovi (ex Hu et al. 2023)]|uniref:ABC transporter ATP-binding protein n=1 Tax=Novosphingobium mangrovi (ex Hu et al. 2023) TaxID=2930094 RepID=A0ABT0A853_9SPHN|nr:ABC transporter ATP-binding protein [Novosphingobium mangrovi (ex Hu et al. 2023)]MCJ1959366.1 ABC transporter ATP-binding protein [Novosphingobium mangrovi (ex Hu et al. 2023)]
MSLATENLSVGERLRDVSIQCRRGMITAICGPNGAGKSTLLSCLADLQETTSGRVMLGERPMRFKSPRERAQWLGYLPQAPDVAWDVAVEVLVSLGRLPWSDAPAGENAQAIEDAISAMDLEELRHRPVSRLSGGERARALMARVLATQPGWLLADEPLASLDLGHGAALMRRFRQQAQQGRGVVLVLHDLATAMNHADCVVVLDKGEVVADGPPETALTRDIVSRIWKCRAQWLGDPGERALSIASPSPASERGMRILD